MRIIFAGTPSNAAHTLETLVAAKIDVVGVLTRQDSVVGRNKVLTESAVANSAKKHGIEVLKANQVTEDVSSWVTSLRADLGVIVAYGSILKKPGLTAPAQGWINLHYSLLPKFPGAAPVQHAILSGESTTGVTVFRLDEGIDTGPILAQAALEISADKTAGDMIESLTVTGSDLLVDTLRHFDERIANQQEQKLPTGMPVAGKISRSAARLDFSSSALTVHNFVRAMNPEPVAWFEYLGTQVRVLRTSAADNSNPRAGECQILGGELIIGCGSGSLKLEQVQPSGKNQMSGADWFRGLRKESILIL